MELKDRMRKGRLPSQAYETADRLNEALPVNVTAHDVEKHPELMKLLTSLSRHIQSDGVSTPVHKDQVQALESLKQNKHPWLQYQLLYLELQELLIDYELQAAAGTLTPAHAQYHTAVQESLNLSELSDYINCNPDPDSSATLFGISLKDLERSNPHKKHVQSIQQKLIPDIEDRLRRKCENLVGLQMPTSQLENDKFTFAKASQLPTILEAEKSSLKEDSLNLKRDQNKKDKQFWEYYQALSESLHIMEELVSKHLVKSQSKNDQITSEWLSARCDALCLKLKLVELQILCMTYTEETVTALKTISKHLDKAKLDDQRELLQTSQILKAYQAFGSDFEAIVQEYTKIHQDIENKQWAIQEFKQSLT